MQFKCDTYPSACSMVIFAGIVPDRAQLDTSKRLFQQHSQTKNVSSLSRLGLRVGFELELEVTNDIV